ncbi:MAG: aromatic amino acid transport family protein [Nanoarchaeota archaeon]
MKKEVLQAIAILIGSIIGAGVLGLPFVFYQSGMWTGILVLILLGITTLTVNLYVGEIALRTKDVHELTGYCEKYLGKKAKKIMTLAMGVSIIGALVAYLIGVGQALGAIFNGNPFFYSIIYFIIMSALIFYGIKSVSNSELILGGIMLTLMILILFFSFNYVKVENLYGFDLWKIFVPYGVILFALIGTSSIPEMRAVLDKNRKELKKSIFLGSLIPILLYGLFAVIILGVTGFNTTEVATIGLGKAIGEHMVLLGNLFAVFSMSTSFLALGLALRWVLQLDYGISGFVSWGVTCITPFLVFLTGIMGFIKAMWFAGAVSGGVEGILLILTFHAAKKKSERKPEYELKYHKILSWVLITMYFIGAVYSIFKLFF